MRRVESEPVPESRRTRFPRWPRRLLSDDTRRVGLQGVAAAREELEQHSCDDSRRARRREPTDE
ncbi:MAG: hypothetical protein OEW42_19895 [Acidimicrobiia bacterium]|nr:hypothetical protein [Acidimicrobiia bacterium]MDH5238010.1 hypothetical protein [Acidimicrobiia bacterium]